jgi:hypothetical protein
MKPSCITAPYRWPSPPGKTCPRRGPVSMSRRVRCSSTQLTAGSVDSGLAALSPLLAVTRDLRSSPVQKFVRYVGKACSGLPNVSGRFTRPSSAVDLSRSHFAGLIAVPIALGVRAVKPFVVGHVSLLAVLSWSGRDHEDQPFPTVWRMAKLGQCCAPLWACELLTWRTPRSCLMSS